MRFKALQAVLKATESKVDWVYDVWDDLVNSLSDENSYQRSIAAMVLCNLAKSDSSGKMAKAIGRLLHLTGDEKFVTSRQCIQSIWKVAIESKSLKQKVADHIVAQYRICTADKHYNLIRLDILQSLRRIFDHDPDAEMRDTAMRLIALETEPKYRKKYEAVWKD